MASEKPSSNNIKQKGMIVAVIAILIILVWQIMGIMTTNETTPVVPTNKAATSANPQTAQGGQPAVVAGAPTQQVPEVPELKQVPVMNEPQFLKMQKLTEEKYVGKLNELEELRVQRQIAETNQAIATAKLATVTAEKNISDLLTKPMMPPSIPIGAYANELVTPARTGTTVVTTTETAPVTPIVDYALISVSMQQHKWSAVLGYQGKFFNVNIGDVLPADGSVVAGINKNSVVLKKEKETRRVNIISSI